MKNKATQTANAAKTEKLKNFVQLSKNELETIVGGPEGSRGTEIVVGH
jgi:bacteriocin-like protein